jgi:dipeptidase E
MRLYLSSFRMGDRFAELTAALPRGAPVAVVSNAVDFIAPETRAAYERDVFDAKAPFRKAGLAPFDLDLRDHFGDPAALAARLAPVRLVWAVGGNAFLLRRALRHSGLDALIPPRLAAGDLIYGGWSAGACVAGPSLKGLHLMDDPAVLAPGLPGRPGYDPAPIWDGLALVPEILVPHFASDHPESDAAARAVAWLEVEGLPFRTLRDGEVIVA